MNNDNQKLDQEPEIPLLEDVVSSDEIESEFLGFVNSEEKSEDSGIPEYDEVLLALRDDIAKQLEDDLHLLVSNVLDQAIREATQHIGRVLHDELDTTLEKRIRYLIDKRLESEFGPRQQLNLEVDSEGL